MGVTVDPQTLRDLADALDSPVPVDRELDARDVLRAAADAIDALTAREVELSEEYDRIALVRPTWEKECDDLRAEVARLREAQDIRDMEDFDAGWLAAEKRFKRERDEARAEVARLRAALTSLHDATEPWVDEAPPGEELTGLWEHRFSALMAARHSARAALGEGT